VEKEKILKSGGKGGLRILRELALCQRRKEKREDGRKRVGRVAHDCLGAFSDG